VYQISFQTDSSKAICPPFFEGGHKKGQMKLDAEVMVAPLLVMNYVCNQMII
jgi:hypothetical protein